MSVSADLQFQVTFDCADPHALARFWAAVLGLEVVDHDDDIAQMLDAGHASPSDVIMVDGQRAWAEAAMCADPRNRYPRLLFLLVPEPKTTKNRVHVDLHLPHGDAADAALDSARAAEVTRLELLGATRLWGGELGPQRWVTMADPEGNEFCIG